MFDVLLLFFGFILISALALLAIGGVFTMGIARGRKMVYDEIEALGKSVADKPEPMQKWRDKKVASLKELSKRGQRPGSQKEPS